MVVLGEQKRMAKLWNCNQGVLHLPLILILLTLLVGGYGVWGILRNWRFVVETQLRLNRCVGLAAQEFRDQLNSISASNDSIVALRASIATAQATFNPELIPALSLSLKSVVYYQEIVLRKWQIRRTTWRVMNGCRNLRDRISPLPDLDYERKLPDQLGEQQLTWRGKMPDEFCLKIDHVPRESVACVEKLKNGAIFQGKSWQAHWSYSKTKRRANFL